MTGPAARSVLLMTLILTAALAHGDEPLNLTLQSQRPVAGDSKSFEAVTTPQSWKASETAIIICDVWDYHHCYNAVQRLEEFAPRLNEVVAEARRRGVTVIHAPSDCMPAYQDHPARQRAVNAAPSEHLPADIRSWCSVIPAEERAVYPIDQSDGGEDDEPAQHAQWAAKLESLGRNPQMPWLKQSDMITIDESHDFISDRGDEVWNILQQRGISNVILTGVHLNMCVLGRPFGLRQMARNGKNVVLMRDMTDTMYNPQRWPYVSHFEGTRRTIAHVERFVCPTITSDQLIGGEPFQFAGDTDGGEPSLDSVPADPTQPDPRKDWRTVSVPHDSGELDEHDQACWYRCVVRLPEEWLQDEVVLKVPGSPQSLDAWSNGTPLLSRPQDDGEITAFVLAAEHVVPDDANLLVVRIAPEAKQRSLRHPPVLQSGDRQLVLEGRWQVRVGDDDAFANMPLPAKFGGATDIVFAPEDPLWTPRAVTRKGEFTSGIEGPACDSAGNIFAVNYARQGTIGRVRPDGQAEVFVELPEGSIGNGIRFDRDGTFLVADYTGHNILRIDPATRAITVFAHSDEMNQPNDLAIAPDGMLYASDPSWAEGTGQLWRIDRSGTVTRLADDMGTTNGIDVSPDGKTLYVNESVQRNVWAFTIDHDHQLKDKRLIHHFADHGCDGMRCDVEGNLYITRHGKGVVAKMSPQGEILREIPVLGNLPSNICFGGPDGRTAYVTEVTSRRLVTFRVDAPGREWNP